MATQMPPRTRDRVLQLDGFPQRGKASWDGGKRQKPCDGDGPETPKKEDLGGMWEFDNVGAWRASRMTMQLVLVHLLGCGEAEIFRKVLRSSGAS